MKNHLGGRLGVVLGCLVSAQRLDPLPCADCRALRLHWSLWCKWVSVSRQASWVLHHLRLLWRRDIGVLAYWIWRLPTCLLHHDVANGCNQWVHGDLLTGLHGCESASDARLHSVCHYLANLGLGQPLLHVQLARLEFVAGLGQSVLHGLLNALLHLLG